MYEFRDVTPRIERMRVKVRDRLIVGDSEKDSIKLEAVKNTDIIRRWSRSPICRYM